MGQSRRQDANTWNRQLNDNIRVQCSRYGKKPQSCNELNVFGKCCEQFRQHCQDFLETIRYNNILIVKNEFDKFLASARVDVLCNIVHCTLIYSGLEHFTLPLEMVSCDDRRSLSDVKVYENEK